MTNISCPSCESKSLSEIQSIPTTDIITLYRRNSIETADQFKDIDSISLLHCSNCDLKFFSPPVAGNENFYNQLQQKDWYFSHPDKTEFVYSKKFISNNNKVLDVGSGRGVWFSYMNDIENLYYQGIEYSAKSIELAGKDGINVIKESVEDHAAKKTAFYDVVAAFQVLEHVDAINDFIAACITCLKPGGKLIYAVPNNDGFLKDLTNNWLNLPPHHINHWNERSLRKIAGIHNLKVLDIHKEKVTNVHKLLYYNIHFTKTINKIIGNKYRLVNTSLPFRIINKLGVWLAKLFTPFSTSHQDQDGHTIIIVFEKQ